MFSKLIIRSFCVKTNIKTSLTSNIKNNKDRFYNIHNNDKTKLINDLKFDIIEQKMINYKLRNDIIQLKNELVKILKNIK